jgi:hypothetical protein
VEIICQAILKWKEHLIVLFIISDKTNLILLFQTCEV